MIVIWIFLSICTIILKIRWSLEEKNKSWFMKRQLELTIWSLKVLHAITQIWIMLVQSVFAEPKIRGECSWRLKFVGNKTWTFLNTYRLLNTSLWSQHCCLFTNKREKTWWSCANACTQDTLHDNPVAERIKTKISILPWKIIIIFKNRIFKEAWNY